MGANARIGSNAVVLEAVPEGATVVGIPGKVVACRDPAGDCVQQLGEDTSGAGGNDNSFESYAVGGDVVDSTAEELADLRNEMKGLREELEQLKNSHIKQKVG